MQTVRILVVGDEKVGKSSLISTLVSQHFSEQVPSIMHDVQIPAEESQENVVTLIMDSSARMDDRDSLVEQMNHVDVVILLYDISRPETFARVSSYWLPLIESTKVLPVVLAGNKIDLSPSNEDQINGANELQKQVVPVLQKYKFVETCLECSAKAVLNIQQVFYFAQKSVVYPISPLLSVNESNLKPKFEKALKRIFRLIDLDRDGLLNDRELNEFQYRCFEMYLQPDDIADLNKVLSRDCSAGLDPGNGIRLSGFLFLIKLFIEKNRPETAWLILRAFGYDSNLDLVVPNEITEIPPHRLDQSCELSSSALNFLKDVFVQFDDDCDGRLSEENMKDIFSICPNPRPPWFDDDCPKLEGSDGIKYLSFSGWSALWSLLTSMDPHVCLLYLYYLGFPGRFSSSINFTRPRSILRTQSHIRQNTLRCFIFGSPHCGKSAILDSFIGRSFLIGYRPTKLCRSICNSVSFTDNDPTQKFLVMSEFPEGNANEMMGEVMNTCDVACLVYEPGVPMSYEYICNMHALIPDTIPCVYVCSKADVLAKDFRDSEEWLSAFEHCRSLELNPPMLVSAKSGQNLSGEDSLFNTLVKVALFPDSARPVTEKKRRDIKYRKTLQIVLGGVILCSGLAAMWLIRSRRRGK